MNCSCQRHMDINLNRVHAFSRSSNSSSSRRCCSSVAYSLSWRKLFRGEPILSKRSSIGQHSSCVWPSARSSAIWKGRERSVSDMPLHSIDCRVGSVSKYLYAFFTSMPRDGIFHLVSLVAYLVTTQASRMPEKQKGDPSCVRNLDGRINVNSTKHRHRHLLIDYILHLINFIELN